MREYHVRICEGLGVKFPGPTRQNLPSLHFHQQGELDSFGVVRGGTS